ncbi:MAG: hypothetical protein CMJ64_25740 [Planctomycetaceae bacterium]|nr:hypothetical protein [Planctomycetaceae bacterium]
MSAEALESLQNEDTRDGLAFSTRCPQKEPCVPTIHACLLAAILVIGQGEIESQDAVTRREIALAIRDLGSSEFEARQAATQLLWKAGEAAKPALRQALDSPRSEVRFRAKSILEDFEYGVFADTPRDVARLIRRYRDANSATRQRAWAELVSRAPIETLLAIINTESNPDRQAALQLKLLARLESDGEIETALQYAQQWQAAHATLSRSAGFDKFLVRNLPYLLSKERYEDAEGVLERAAGPGADEKAVRNLAVFMLLRGKLDERIEVLRKRMSEDAKTDDLKRLAMFLRVKGDIEEAKVVAVQGGDETELLVRRLLFDSRDWKQLSQQKLEEDPFATRSIEQLGFKAAYSRLAGNKEQFDKTIAAIRKLASHASGNELSYCREAFFLNGLTDDAIRLLTRDDREQAFNVQVMRNEYEEAFETYGIGTTREERAKWLQTVLDATPDRSANSTRRFKIACQTAQLLRSLGEKAEAVEMFGQLATVAERMQAGGNLRVLAEFELKAGLTDQAFAHGAKALYKEPDVSVIDVLFKRHQSAVKVWSKLYEELNPTENVTARLTKLRKLFYRGKVDDEVLRLLTEGYDTASGLSEDHPQRTKRINVVADTCLLRGQKDLARQYFETIADQSDAAAVHLADVFAQEEEWQTASQWYAKGFELGRKPYMLYLSGEMLKQAGETEQGQKAMELAKLIPLASESRHGDLAAELAKRGYTAEAIEQWDLLRRCSTWSEAQMFHAVGALGDAVSAEDPLKASGFWEQRMLNCLQENWFFTDQTSYVRIPHLVHRSRAKGLLAQGNASGAILEVRHCQQIWPGELNVVEECIPLLDAGGRKADADELFTEAYSRIEKTCRLFPNSALHHNNLAWLAAKCQRRLDKALIHVERALELAPDSAQYIDTLAEVHFQRGDIDEAIEQAERCIELEPDTEFYQQQLKRFEEAKSE